MKGFYTLDIRNNMTNMQTSPKFRKLYVDKGTIKEMVMMGDYDNFEKALPELKKRAKNKDVTVSLGPMVGDYFISISKASGLFGSHYSSGYATVKREVSERGSAIKQVSTDEFMDSYNRAYKNFRLNRKAEKLKK